MWVSPSAQPAQYRTPPPQPQAQAPVYGGGMAGSFTPRNIGVMVLGIIAGILILLALFGSWSGGIEMSADDDDSTSYGSGYEMGLSIGEIKDVHESLEMMGTWASMGMGVEIDGRSGVEYNLLYILAPAGLLIMVFAILAPFATAPSFPIRNFRRHVFTIILVFSIITILLSALGILLVVTDDITMSLSMSAGELSSSSSVTYSFMLGYAGFLGIVGGVIGLIAAMMFKTSYPANWYRPGY